MRRRLTILIIITLVSMTSCTILDILNSNWAPEVNYYRVIDAVWVNDNEVYVGISFDQSGYGDANGFIIKYINWETKRAYNYYNSFIDTSAGGYGYPTGIQRMTLVDNKLFIISTNLEIVDTMSKQIIAINEFGYYTNLSPDSNYSVYYSDYFNGNFIAKSNISGDSVFYTTDTILSNNEHFNIDWDKKIVFWYNDQNSCYYDFGKDSIYRLTVENFEHNCFDSHTYSKVFDDSIRIWDGYMAGNIITIIHPFTDSMYETVSNKVDNWFSNSNGEYIDQGLGSGEINLYSSDGTVLKTIQFDRSEIE